MANRILFHILLVEMGAPAGDAIYYRQASTNTLTSIQRAARLLLFWHVVGEGKNFNKCLN
jgi:predicted 2-oxoglutarate/Fe(II)-dependent dioxygenase YbiX